MSAKAFDAVVIGASAGALDALSALLPALPAGYPLPVMIVVHLPADKKNLMPDLLGPRCAVRICEAEDKEPLEGGAVYFAPPDYHMQVEKGGTISLSSDAPVLFSRPSIDVLFETAADAYGSRLIGVILTGANPDGAEGLRAICEAGGVALVQRPEEAYAAEMPCAALAACTQAHSFTLAQIADYLQEAAL